MILSQTKNRSIVLRTLSSGMVRSGILATMLSSGALAPVMASVTVDLNNLQTVFANDGDSGYYLQDGNTSSQVISDDVFKTPVGRDGQPRWPACTSEPCAKIPTPQSPPGSSKATSVRSLTPTERSFIKQEFQADAASGLQDSGQKLAQVRTLQLAMASTSSELVDVEIDKVDKAFKPVRQALLAAKAVAPSDAVVLDAEVAIKLQENLKNFNQSRQRATAKVAGMNTVSCDLLKNGVSRFNRIAGTDAVTYYEQKAPLALLGLDSCISTDSIERDMVKYLESILDQAGTSGS